MRHLKEGAPGSRFLDCFHYKRKLRDRYGSVFQIVDTCLGLGLVVGGLIMVPLPGPGWIIVGLGFALLAGESERVARFMDRQERVLRIVGSKTRRGWTNASLMVKSLIAITSGALVGSAGYGAFLILQNHFAN